MKTPNNFRTYDANGRSGIGSYNLSPEERKQVMEENIRRGKLSLITERNTDPVFVAKRRTD